MKTKTENRFPKNVKVLKDTRDFDSRGNVVDLLAEENPKMEVEEPYDPAYLEEGNGEVDVKIKKGELSYMKKVGVLEKALRRRKIPYVWEGSEFSISKEDELTGEPQVRFLYVNDGYYVMATLEEDLWESTSVGAIMEKVNEFLNVRNLKLKKCRPSK